MSNLDALGALRSAYYGSENSDVGVKSYSLRLPLSQYAFVEVLASQNGVSRNEILTNLIKLGISEFYNSLGAEGADLHQEVEHYIVDEYESLK